MTSKGMIFRPLLLIAMQFGFVLLTKDTLRT